MSNNSEFDVFYNDQESQLSEEYGYVQKFVNKWRLWRARHFKLYHFENSHICDPYKCTIVPILFPVHELSTRLKDAVLHGCIETGYVKICNFMNNKCSYIIETDNSSKTCIYCKSVSNIDDRYSRRELETRELCYGENHYYRNMDTDGDVYSLNDRGNSSKMSDELDLDDIDCGNFDSLITDNSSGGDILKGNTDDTCDNEIIFDTQDDVLVESYDSDNYTYSSGSDEKIVWTNISTQI